MSPSQSFPKEEPAHPTPSRTAVPEAAELITLKQPSQERSRGSRMSPPQFPTTNLLDTCCLMQTNSGQFNTWVPVTTKCFFMRVWTTPEPWADTRRVPGVTACICNTRDAQAACWGGGRIRHSHREGVCPIVFLFFTPQQAPAPGCCPLHLSPPDLIKSYSPFTPKSLSHASTGAHQSNHLNLDLFQTNLRYCPAEQTRPPTLAVIHAALRPSSLLLGPGAQRQTADPQGLPLQRGHLVRTQ